MHIPDGYLSPQTCGALGVAMVPLWATAASRVRRVVTRRFVPGLAVAAAFSFLVMMFNIPVPGGTTAHAVGAVLIAVLLGPWAAVIAVSVALAIQALFFGDGGVLSFGANAFNMAFVMPFVGYGVYRLVGGSTPVDARRRALAAGLGGYVGLNVAALAAAVEFGVQPTWFHTADGTPLYAPFHLAQTVPAMAIAHLLVAGVAEFAVTAGVVAYLQRANPALLAINHHAVEAAVEPAGVEGPTWWVRWRWALVGLGVMVLATPIGLLAPGGAFGEDAPGDLDLGRYGLQAVPEGLNRYNGLWSHALLGDYGFGEGQNATVGYLVSAVVGIAVIAVVVVAAVGLLRLLRRRAEPSAVRDEALAG